MDTSREPVTTGRKESGRNCSRRPSRTQRNWVRTVQQFGSKNEYVEVDTDNDESMEE
jgi:hypothetical protein